MAVSRAKQFSALDEQLEERGPGPRRTTRRSPDDGPWSATGSRSKSPIESLEDELQKAWSTRWPRGNEAMLTTTEAAPDFLGVSHARTSHPPARSPGSLPYRKKGNRHPGAGRSTRALQV